MKILDINTRLLFYFFCSDSFSLQPFIWKSLTWYLYLRKDVANNIFVLFPPSFLLIFNYYFNVGWTLTGIMKVDLNWIIVLYFSKVQEDVSRPQGLIICVQEKKQKQKTISYLYNPQGKNIRWKKYTTFI